MVPRIEKLLCKKLVGIRLGMSFSHNKTKELWQSFMPRRGEVQHRNSTDYISMQRFGSPTDLFTPEAVFEKWATVEVSEFADIPNGMEMYTLKGGDYAVFEHQGAAAEAPRVMGWIFREWLPNSGYLLDHREHFEILPKDYNPLDPKAREEIWIPVQTRGR